MSIVSFCNKVIEYSFYALFFLVPLVFTGNTSELFELNKMWLAWGLTIIIGASWFTKMIAEDKFKIQRTPLDIPILLFLSSQILSTIFSWDRHISFWGYYSRFNGGLLSTITYIFLYYAFVSNIGTIKVVWRILFVSLISGLIVGLWGLPSHFGYDPTCFIFRGTFDVSCWTADFQPRARIFSTIGQPAWLAAYLAVLIPIAIVFFKNSLSRKNLFFAGFFLLLVILFYVDLLFTSTRAGVLGLWISLIFLFLAYVWIRRNNIKSAIINIPLLILLGTFVIVTFIIGNPIPQIYNFTLPGLKANFAKTKVTNTPEKPAIQDQSQPAVQKTTEQPQVQAPSGGSESGDIRRLVWEGGLEAWKNNPIFGTGVETFAFAYYKYKPVGQNRVSEWNFLYNKAHNEYVNYLATTGTFGLGTYLLMIGWFIFIAIRQFKIQNSKFKIAIQNSKLKNEKLFTLDSNFSLLTLNFALLASYISILVTNFFGFSVVIMNLYLFLIPAFVLTFGGMIFQGKTNPAKVNYPMSIWQWTPVFLILTGALYMLIALFNYWRADISYSLGYNLNRTGEYQQAYENLHKAVGLRQELVFQDELAVNNAILAVALLSDPTKKEDPQTITTASSLAQEAVSISDQIVSRSPKNIVFWKSRVRLFFTLSQVDGRYLPKALEAIEKASLLAPNDANILYNLGVLYGQNNKIAKGIEILEKTIALKPDYTDAHYALGLFYHSLSMDEAQKVVVDKALNEKAIAQMQYILTNISSTHTPAKDAIRDWTQQ